MSPREYRYEYVGYLARDPFNKATVFPTRGEVIARGQSEAYDYAEDAIKAASKLLGGKFYFLNWFVRRIK